MTNAAKTVTIYCVTCTKARGWMGEPSTVYSLTPWSSNTPDYEGYDDGGEDYVLPDGYLVAPEDGLLYFWDKNGNQCPLITLDNGPAIVTADETLALKRTQ